MLEIGGLKVSLVVFLLIILMSVNIGFVKVIGWKEYFGVRVVFGYIVNSIKSICK